MTTTPKDLIALACNPNDAPEPAAAELHCGRRSCRPGSDHCCPTYWAVLPPSITSSDPVMKDDSSEARYRTP